MESTLLAYAFGLPKMDTEPKGQGLVVNLGFVALQPAEPQNELPEPSIVLALPPGKAPN
jgi:hypothetical protein